ncbi:MAG: hypothetical protein ABXS91_01470 [Sulfurimonas sp.]
MESRRYCPYCKSFDIKRKTRGFFKKFLLRVPPLYQCNTCQKVFTEKETAENKKAYE